MASLPETDDQPQVAGEIVVLDPIDVQIGERMRQIDPVWAEALGHAMKRDGQIHPIDICQLPGKSGWWLAGPGGHRLTGAQIAGIPVEARIVSNQLSSRQRREAAENLFRRNNDPIERASAIATLVKLHKERAGLDPAADGRVASANARWQKVLSEDVDDAEATMARAYGWSEEIAAEIGVSSRTMKRGMMLYRRLVPSVIARLRDAKHPTATNQSQLYALAKLDEHAQAKVVDLLLVPSTSLNYDQPKTIGDAIAHPLGPKPAAAKPDAETKRLSAFIGAFQRMSLAEKKGALAQLAGQLPNGTRIVDGADPLPRAEFSPKHVEYRDDALAAIDSARELIDGLVEDEVVPGERGEALARVSSELQLTRFTIAGNGFQLGEDA